MGDRTSRVSPVEFVPQMPSEEKNVVRQQEGWIVSRVSFVATTRLFAHISIPVPMDKIYTILSWVYIWPRVCVLNKRPMYPHSKKCHNNRWWYPYQNITCLLMMHGW